MKQVENRTDWTEIPAEASARQDDHSGNGSDRDPMSNLQMSDMKDDEYNISGQQQTADDPDKQSSVLKGFVIHKHTVNVAFIFSSLFIAKIQGYVPWIFCAVRDGTPKAV